MAIPRIGRKVIMRCKDGPMAGHKLNMVTEDSTLRFSMNGMIGRYVKDPDSRHLIWREG